MIEVTFKFTESELYQGILAIALSRTMFRAYRAIGIISIIFFIFFLYRDINHNVTLPFYAFFFLSFRLYLTIFVELSCKIVTKKYIKTKAQITEHTIYIFDEKSYQLTGESFSTRIDYNKLYDVKEVSDFVLLRLSEGIAHALPKRAFSDDQFNTFKNIVRSIQGLKSTFKE